MSRSVRMYLQDMRKGCARVQRYVVGLDQQEFADDEKTFDAAVRNLEIIGEAAKHVPDEIRDLYPQVEWRKIAGLRDVIAHAYFGIDEDILWDIIKNQIPVLETQVDQVLSLMQGE